LENLEDIAKFLHTFDVQQIEPRTYTNNLNTSVTMDESPNKEKPRTFTAQFYQTFKE
jgi:hypothetical protein